MAQTKKRSRRGSRGRRAKDKWVSPIGQAHTEAARKRFERSAAYRAEWERTRPYQEIARIAILRRTDLDLTQEEIAQRMGTTKSVVSRIESGRHPTSLNSLKRLAEALEMQLVVGFEASPSNGAKHKKRELIAV